MKRSVGVMGKSVVEEHDTGRVDIFWRSKGDLFGESDVETDKHGHVVLKADDSAVYVRNEGNSRTEVLKSEGKAPRDQES